MRLRTVAGAVGGFAGLAVLNRRLEKVGEPARIGGEERRYPWRDGELAYRVAGEPDARPLLLVHGIYAGASSYEAGARYFPAAFVSGKLNLGLADHWPKVPHRTPVALGQEARTTPVSQAQQFILMNPRTELKVFRDAALLPHDERAATFNEEVKTFLLDEAKLRS